MKNIILFSSLLIASHVFAGTDGGGGGVKPGMMAVVGNSYAEESIVDGLNSVGSKKAVQRPIYVAFADSDKTQVRFWVNLDSTSESLLISKPIDSISINMQDALIRSSLSKQWQPVISSSIK